ncbi:hypothetical protein HK405_004999 [Cladochytrium tenue]|nr:hypothetical protein HK405_004999 [Cladochytrium tenue]
MNPFLAFDDILRSAAAVGCADGGPLGTEEAAAAAPRALRHLAAFLAHQCVIRVRPQPSPVRPSAAAADAAAGGSSDAAAAPATKERVAKMLSFKVVEAEAYLSMPSFPSSGSGAGETIDLAHVDPYTHAAAEQGSPGQWYFHKQGSGYKSGTRKGLDVTFGMRPKEGSQPGFHGGFLIRALVPVHPETLRPTASAVEGPCLIVEALMTAAGFDHRSPNAVSQFIETILLRNISAFRSSPEPNLPGLWIDVVSSDRPFDIPFSPAAVESSSDPVTPQAPATSASVESSPVVAKETSTKKRPADLSESPASKRLAFAFGSDPAGSPPRLYASPRIGLAPPPRSVANLFTAAARGSGPGAPPPLLDFLVRPYRFSPDPSLLRKRPRPPFHPLLQSGTSPRARKALPKTSSARARALANPAAASPADVTAARNWVVAGVAISANADTREQAFAVIEEWGRIATPITAAAPTASPAALTREE